MKLITSIFLFRSLCIAICIGLLFSCASGPKFYNHLRVNAIPPAKEIFRAVKIGSIESNFYFVSNNNLSDGFTKSLAGNNYLGEPDQYIINVNLTKGSISWGSIGTATVSINYDMIDSLTGEKVFDTTVESTATAIYEMNLRNVLMGDANQEKYGLASYHTGAANKKTDLEFGFPEPGTPINAKDGMARQQFVVHTALRKNFAEFLDRLNKSFNK